VGDARAAWASGYASRFRPWTTDCVASLDGVEAVLVEPELELEFAFDDVLWPSTAASSDEMRDV